MKQLPIITIARQYGSGGRYVGKLLAEQLNIPFYDKEVLTLAAKESGIAESLFARQESQSTTSMLFSLVTGFQNQGNLGAAYMDMPLNHKIFLAQFEAIKKIAAEGPCVIVGRCADYVLAENENAVRCFILADMKARIARAVTHYGIPGESAESILLKKDKQRASYYDYYAAGKWGDVNNYNLTVDTGAVGVQGAVDVIKAFIEAREKRDS